ncbi:MAG: peptide-methionine (R)-S-oxide reductase MsrB [Candidatus Paceibacterota bacterium]
MKKQTHDLPGTDQEWKDVLTPEQYRVMREKGTEKAFSGTVTKKGEGGAYRCSACGQVLFLADAQFDSGSGWPSFDKAIDGAVRFERDSSGGEERTEVLCAHCNSHLGHVFDDGPEHTTGKRFCINAVCLD